MSLDTLLEAAIYLESSTKSASKVFSASARATNGSNSQTQRKRAISESSEGERRRRPGGAGTRETHNKLEKNRRAHLKECFDILKSEVPSLEDKKTSNLNILRSAFKYIQALKKLERQFEAERDSLTIGNRLLKERLRALKEEFEPQVEVDKYCESEDLVEKKILEKVASPLNTSSTSEKVGQIYPVSVATQTTFSSVMREAPYSPGDLSNVSIHSGSTESTQEDEDVDIDGYDEDEKDVEVDVVDEIKEKQKLSEVEEKREDKIVKKPKRDEEEKTNSNLFKRTEGVEDTPVARNGTLLKTSFRRRSSFDEQSNGETSQEEFDYESFKPKIQSCARVSC